MGYTPLYELRNFGGNLLFGQTEAPFPGLPTGRWTRLTAESVYDYNFDPNVLAQAAALPVTSPDGVVPFNPMNIGYTTDPAARATIYNMYHPATGGGGNTGNPTSPRPATPATGAPTKTRRRHR